MGWYVYMLLCGDGTLYTGITDDVQRRLAVHRAGKGAKYTRGRGPLELAYTEELPDKSTALKREIEIKKLSRPEKLISMRRALAQLAVVDSTERICRTVTELIQSP